VSRQNVERIRAVYERWAEGDFRAGGDLWDPAAVFIQRPGFPEAGTYLGPEEISRYMRHFLGSWTQITIVAEEIIEAGDSVVVAVRQRGVGTGSGAVTELRYFHVWTFRGPRAVRWENFRERAEALEAVGLDGAAGASGASG
jgi:ketosteroid isomerase-like protein